MFNNASQQCGISLPVNQTLAPPTRSLLSLEGLRLAQSDRFTEVITLLAGTRKLHYLCRAKSAFQPEEDGAMTPLSSFLLPLTGEISSRMLPRRTERFFSALLFGVLLASVSASIPGKLLRWHMGCFMTRCSSLCPLTLNKHYQNGHGGNFLLTLRLKLLG